MRRIVLLCGFLLLLGCPGKPPPYPECKNDGDCKDHAQVCIGGAWQGGRGDAPWPGNPPPYPECKNDGDCKDHAQVCIGGTCKECRDDSQCSQKPGTACQDNICVAKAQCQSSRDCGEGQKCSADKKCVAECSDAS